jgi:hypothetical protein
MRPQNNRKSKMMVSRLNSLRWVSLVVLACLAPMTLQANETTSAIRGKVVNSSGSPLANVSVQVKDERTSGTKSFTTNESGTFYAPRLAVGGPYSLIVDGRVLARVGQISLGDDYSVTLELNSQSMEEVVVYGDASSMTDVAAGPSATFSNYDLETSIAFERDLIDVISLDPRINIDQSGFEVNCAGKHPRFNSVTLDGVSQNDRFGLNSNPYSTATGMPFPYDAIEQVSAELAPFDVTYGGFSACNINAVTKQGSNEWEGKVFYEYTSDDLRGDQIGDTSISSPGYTEDKWGLAFGGPIMKDKLFIFGAYETSQEPRFIGMGYAGSGNAIERDWLPKADYDRIVAIANDVYDYDPGGQPSDGAQENEKYMVRLDWIINDQHDLAIIYNYFDGFQDRASDGDSNEFEFANHYYVKGAESETTTLKLSSQWTDAFSTELFYSDSEMIDGQVTRGPKDFGDFQISYNGRSDTIYLGADDSRQANRLFTKSKYFRLVGNYLVGDHLITAGFESEELEIFNMFVQHSRGGEWDFFDDSQDNPESCSELSAQGRFDAAECGTSGIDKFELGRPSRIYYGSAGGSNDATDAAANFTNKLNSVFVQDEWIMPDSDLTLVFGLRYDYFDSDDRPTYNAAFTNANGGIRNDANLDGVDLLMPRIGLTWEPSSDLSVRAGLGLYSGGNPNVWISNAWSNDGISNVQLQFRNFDGSGSVLDGSIALQGTGAPGRAIPQTLYDQVAATGVDSGSTRGLVLVDPDYQQPGEWKAALGATYRLPFQEIQMDIDYLFTRGKDNAYYVDLSQEIVGQTITGAPIYDFVNGSDNLMLTNTSEKPQSHTFSVAFQKDYDFGLDLTLGYAYTDGEDVSPMTSSVAVSNYENLATLDINDPGVGTSNYVVPHRFTFRASYARELIPGLTSRFTLYGYAAEGQAQSYVMGSQDLEGDGFYGRHLLYVPTGESDPNVVFADGFDTAAFFAFVDQQGLGSGYVARNGSNADWSYRLDFRFDQELPTFNDQFRGKFFLKIFNLGNLLNDDWGEANDAQFFSVQMVNSSVNEAGQYVFERFNNGRTVNDLYEQRSLWEVRMGLEFSF